MSAPARRDRAQRESALVTRPALLANENVPRLLVTFDRDYGELVFARAVAAPPSIVFVRQQPRKAEEFAVDVLALMDRPDFAQGHLVVMAERRMRRRALPA
jgi:hypothetical protein